MEFTSLGLLGSAAGVKSVSACTALPAPEEVAFDWAASSFSLMEILQAARAKTPNNSQSAFKVTSSPHIRSLLNGWDEFQVHGAAAWEACYPLIW
jgi:hypothetical protein